MNLKKFKTTSLTQIVFGFDKEIDWNETITTRLDTDWKEIDNILCDQKFSKLEKLIFEIQFDTKLFENQVDYRVSLLNFEVHTMLKKLLPKFYKRNLIYIKKNYFGRY